MNAKTPSRWFSLCAGLATFLLANTCFAQPSPPQPNNAPGTSPSSRTYAIVDRGPNSRTWASTVTEITSQGGTLIRTNLIYELATGMHYRDTNGVWQQSQELFTVLPDRSGAVAVQGPYHAYVPADIYEGVIGITLPSGEVIHTRPVSISYFDGTNNVLIAELTNSTAQLSLDGRCANNHIVRGI